ncbi:protein Mis18-beta [Etheostoma spectabile]|uniref:protein Mis18-beta n=1 Tax=Etheostoma spectabile TaxID=54343 RepID=UPI0013AF0238|nr:protein Mis18-beta-like [Etheostoma spectabile]
MEFDESVLIQRTNAAKLATEAEARQRMTLHCQQCNTVLGDSLGVCGEITCLDAIVCIRVTEDVVISDAVESGDKDVMANCIYSSLICRGCRWAVGKVIHSAPSRLATVRAMFLLYKANTSCYILNSCSMVKASTLTFDLKPLSESMNKVRQQFEGHLDQISLFKSRLADRRVTREFV